MGRKGKDVPAKALEDKPSTGKSIPQRLRPLNQAHESSDWFNSRPSWSFSVIDYEYTGEWGWDRLGGRLGAVFDFLKEMERLTWKEIATQSYRPKIAKPSAKHHAIAQDSLCKDARERLAELELDDVDQVFRFRTGFDERLWGLQIPNSGVFCLLWWDPQHRVYPLDR